MEQIKRLLGLTKEAELKAYVGPAARDRIWEYAWMTQPSDKARESYVRENYWNKRVKPTLLTFLQKLYNNRGDLLPGLSEEQIYSIASVVRNPFEETRRDIEPILGDRLIVSPAVALIYGIKNGGMVDFSSLKPYGTIRKEANIEGSDDSVEFTVKLCYKDMKFIFGLPDFPSEKIEGKYKIRRIVKERKIEKEEKI